MVKVQYKISELNQLNQSTFVQVLGEIFEQTPAIAAQAWEQRPFADVTALHQTMVDIVRAMNLAEQLTLIRAHPDLGSRAKMAEASVQEQAGVGLDRLSATEYEQFLTLNQAYKDKFEFPFIIAVRNQTKSSILQAFEQRLNHSTEVEIQQALTEIAQIAKFRLLDLVVNA